MTAGHSKLFVSCDLVGSTQFKQKEPGWQKVFLSFYREFPQFVARANRDATQADAEPLVFHLWKAVGDELIFEVLVETEEDLGAAVRVWLDAMAAYETQTLADVGLALKGGAFVATFPGPDSESTIPRNPKLETSDDPVVWLNEDALKGKRAYSKYLFDYFGPSIDTGFRVFGLATRRYFTLSVEAAWALAAAAHSTTSSKVGTEMHFVSDVVLHGTHALKGVWAGREYPVFAIDREHGDAVNIALSQIEHSTMTPEKIIDVCHACHQDAKWPSGLYLPRSTNPVFVTPPTDAMADLRENEPRRISPSAADGTGANLEPEPPLGLESDASVA